MLALGILADDACDPEQHDCKQNENSEYHAKGIEEMGI
jgi:hypothetical protein